MKACRVMAGPSRGTGRQNGRGGTRGRTMTQDWLQRRAYNAAAELVDSNIECGRADKVAFTDAERTLTYGALQADTCRFASGLMALGLRPESRIALLMLDTVDFPIAFWG